AGTAEDVFDRVVVHLHVAGQDRTVDHDIPGGRRVVEQHEVGLEVGRRVAVGREFPVLRVVEVPVGTVCARPDQGVDAGDDEVDGGGRFVVDELCDDVRHGAEGHRGETVPTDGSVVVDQGVSAGSQAESSLDVDVVDGVGDDARRSGHVEPVGRSAQPESGPRT